MELPNIHFENFPIEFKQINTEDFPEFEVSEKIIISPDLRGFINDVLQEKINLEDKNTVVINAAVGQGKSTAIIKTLKRYYDDPRYMIIVASPFVSLVEQYCSDIHSKAEIPEEQIYNYGDLGRDTSINYKARRVQIVTVNTLLGNPGEEGFKNSDIKRKYLNDLIGHCESNGIRVVFIYDEIHDAIQNFQEEFIFSLWKWRNVIHKNFILSATYNEASKVVIEYLAELTDKKIQIIESERVILPKKQSKLCLHFSPAHNFTESNPELEKVIKDLLNLNKKIDILCYSKALAKGIIRDKVGIGKLLKDRFGEINDCTSELISNQRAQNEVPKNRYDNEKCNIGTNFKTGVSIEKANHAFVIIMPPRATRLWFRNKYGIFSGGINSVIQALARQRKKGEIHIIMPQPDRFDYESLSFANFSETQINSFEQLYEKVKYYSEDETMVKYFPLITQDFLTLYFYKDNLLSNVYDEIRHIDVLERETLSSLKFPEYKTFKLRRGEEYLANTFKFFGEDIAAYLTYCAFTNQFANCRLGNVTFKTALFFEEGKIQEKLEFYFNTYFGDLYYNSVLDTSNFNKFYQDIRNKFFGSFNLKIKNSLTSKWVTIKPYHKNFENQLLRFCGILYYQTNYYYSEDFKNRLRDVEYTRSTYFLDCIAIAKTIVLEEVDYLERDINRIKAYQNMGLFRERLLENIGHFSRGTIEYDFFPVKPFQGFILEGETRLFEETITFLIESDDLIKNDVFNFRRNFIGSNNRPKPLQKRIESFYKILLEDFFNFSDIENYPKVTIGERLQRVRPIDSIKELPNPNLIIDTLNASQIKADYEKELQEFAIGEYGSYEAYKEIINLAIAQLQGNIVE